MVIFEDYGVGIILKDNRYYIRYDAGELLIECDEINADTHTEIFKKIQCAYFNL